MSIPRIARPVLVLAVAVVGRVPVDQPLRRPARMQNLKDAFVQMATSNPSAAFAGDQVINDFPGNKIFVGKQERAIGWRTSGFSSWTRTAGR